MTNVRTATLAELDIVLDWAAAEGWNPGLDDAVAFFAADPDGFFVATDADDTPIAAISVVNHSPHYAFLGLYIVTPGHRGRGVGFDLWTHAIAHAGARTIGLDGVEAQQDNYAASGFRKAGGTTRYIGEVDANREVGILPAETQDLPALIVMEAAATGTSKPAYLTAWFNASSHRQTFVHKTGDKITGFCTVRMCRDGAKIGPLVAETATQAQRLLCHAASVFPGPLIIDVPDASTGLSHLCQSRGMTPGFRTARMYRGPEPSGSHPFFAVTSLELG
ncbi:MAG: GNAT family N-acetyltransferase [Pseudomonadota bacterium]